MTQENAGADAVLGAAAGLAGGAVAGAVATFKAASSIMDKISSGPSTQKFEVNKDNVLQASKVIMDQAERLRDELRVRVYDLRIPVDAHAADKVSSDIVEAWNDRLVDNRDSYAARVDGYIKSLNGLAKQLRASAEQYGFTEEEITTTFGPKA